MYSTFRRRVKSATAGHFWLRYLLHAGYRALCAGTLVLTARTFSGSSHARNSVEQAIGYITSVFGTYKAAAAVERFHGRVAEIGPGDSCGVGLMFLADGCEKVDLLDRFFSLRNERHQRAINRVLVQRFPQLTPALRNQDFSESSFANLNRHYRKRAAAETFFETNKFYDFIVSCSVFEHLYDPMLALSAAASALNPGGVMLHSVDCRDHEQFSQDFHELKFLELPPSLYAPLKWGGGPNRVRLSSYVEVLRRQALDFTIYITALAGVPEPIPGGTILQEIPGSMLDASRQYISKVRHRLAKPFRDMSDEDLMVTGFLLVARKNNPQKAAELAPVPDP